MLRKIVKALIPAKLFAAIEPTGHLLEAVAANIWYGFPARGLNVIGVTGTDGKTSTSTLIYAMLNDAGIKTGLMTTIGYGTPDDWRPNYVHMTSVPVFMLMKRIKELKARGIQWLVLETTSHALAQHRVWGVPYSVAVMTNINHEHLDYHGTFERYRAAKLELFKLANSNKAGMRVGIVNADDPSAKLFAGAVANAITYGVQAGDLKASGVKSTTTGNDFTVGGLKIHTQLPGAFNVYNALAAVAVGRQLGLTDEQIARGIASLANVEGRMTSIDEGQDFAVIVDFAHTPQSFEKILGSMRKLVKGQLIVVFGSAGRRDEAKRAVQGEQAGKFADLVVVTEEDDRDIDGDEIMGMIAGGAKKAGKIIDKDLFLIHDRTEAIEFALGKAKKGDTVLLLGKGHEKTIEGPDGERPWDESGVARQALKKLQKK